MIIREAKNAELSDVLYVEGQAFGNEKEAALVRALLNDHTAKPTLSLMAFVDNKAVGHILFSKLRIFGSDRDDIRLLAPLAVIPDYQKQGVGGALISEGLTYLKRDGVSLVFVLGHPGYYPRHGFTPAGRFGFAAPYPIPEKDAGAWMVQELKVGVLGSIGGNVVCAEALDRPEYWRE